MKNIGQTSIIGTLVLALILAAFGSLEAGKSPERAAQKVSVGFFEGGDSPEHQAFRRAFTEQLELLLPDGYELQLVASGFKTADWKRDTCRLMAAQLSADTALDIIVALGPWTVEDLLEAGCRTPIVSALRFDPILEQIVDSMLRPIAPNLTVRIRPTKIESDIASLKAVTGCSKLGFLHFPSGDEAPEVLNYVKSVGEKYGLEVISAEGFDNSGMFAFYKAYPQLRGKVDALYLSPFWGFNIEKTNQFYAMAARDGLPVISFGPSGQVERGALFTASYESVQANAYCHAWKVAQIVQGVVPWDLPTVVETMPQVMISGSTSAQLQIDYSEEMMRQALYLDVQPDPDSVPTMLFQSIEQAMLQNPDHLERQQLLQETARRVQRIAAGYWPQLRLEAEAAYRDENSVNNRYDEIANGYLGAGLVLDQKLLSMKTIKAIQSGAARLRTDSASVRVATLELELAISTAFLDCLQAEDILQIRRGRFQDLTRIVQISGVRNSLEGEDHVDHLRWRDERYRARADLLLAEADLQICRSVLNLLLGRPAEAELYLDRTRYSREIVIREYAELLPFVGTPEKASWSAAVLETLALRLSPRLEAARQGSNLIRRRLSENKARYWPTIGFQARLNVVDDLVNSPTFDEEPVTWTVRGLVEFPLFQGGDRRRERRQLQATFERSEYRQDAEAFRVMKEVRTILSRMTALLKTLPFMEESNELARLFSEGTQKEYFGGERSYLELLDGMNNYTQAEVRMLETQYDYWRDAASLVTVSGLSVAGERYPAGVIILNQLKEANH